MLCSCPYIYVFPLVSRSPVVLPWQVDKVGRRPFILWGACGCTVSLLSLSFGFAVGLPVICFVACCVLVAAYALSFGPVTWLVTAEMFPAGVRGKALGIGQVSCLRMLDRTITLLSPSGI